MNALQAPTNVEPIDEIVGRLYRDQEFDFRDYKSSYVERRIRRRMKLLDIENVATYADLMRSSAAENARLMSDLTINVTGFFRDERPFDILRDDILPALLRYPRDAGRAGNRFCSPSRDEVIRVWCPGCSTGEEPYSVAMLIREIAEEAGPVPKIKVFGTDICGGSLAAARRGLYASEATASLAPGRRDRWLEPAGDRFRIRREIRDIVCFGFQNLAINPPISHVDLILCRNVLIYFNRSLQNRILAGFIYALRPGGYLVLGKSEVVFPQFHDVFMEIDRKARVYRKRAPEGETA